MNVDRAESVLTLKETRGRELNIDGDDEELTVSAPAENMIPAVFIMISSWRSLSPA